MILAEGLNLGPGKMAGASSSHDFPQLSRLSRRHVESDAIKLALAMVIEAHARLPMPQLWGEGLTASSDGQFFPTTRQGEAINLVNARYGHEPGLKSYTHLSDQYDPFATQLIPATVNEAPFILDGLLMNETGRRIRDNMPIRVVSPIPSSPPRPSTATASFPAFATCRPNGFTSSSQKAPQSDSRG